MIKDNYENLNEVNNNHYPQKIALLLVFIVSMIINALCGSGKFGKSIGQVSDKYPTLITPPGYAFSIWSVIYTLWALFVVFQMFPDSNLSDPVHMYDMGWSGLWIWLILANVFSCLWLIIFILDTNTSAILQLVFIYVYLFTLIVIF